LRWRCSDNDQFIYLLIPCRHISIPGSPLVSIRGSKKVWQLKRCNEITTTKPVFEIVKAPTMIVGSTADQARAQQFVWVRPRPPTEVTTTLELWQFANRSWQRLLSAVPVSLGRNGFAAAGAKREGDGKTPTGIFALGPAFGYDESFPTPMPYRRCTQSDFWIDDPASQQYNQWVQAPPESGYSEPMWRDDQLYRLGLVIAYNCEPIIPGAGSAIFIHPWRRRQQSTAGCVALEETDLALLLMLLQPAMTPRICLGTALPGLSRRPAAG